MIDASSTDRLGTALVALLFALGWGVPTVHAGCVAALLMSPEHCGEPGTAQHCDGTMGATSAARLSLQAGQDALTDEGTAEDHLRSGVGAEPTRLFGSTRRVFFSRRLSARSAIHSVSRLHARVRVWLE